MATIWEAVSRGDGGAPESYCGTLTLTRATTSDARGIEVEYAVDGDWQARTVDFFIYRSARRVARRRPHRVP